MWARFHAPLISVALFVLFWKEKFRLNIWNLSPVEFPFYLRQTSSQLCEAIGLQLLNWEFQHATKTTVSLPHSKITPSPNIYEYIRLYSSVMHDTWISCTFWLYPGSSLGKVSDPANLQAMSGCCLGECNLSRSKPRSGSIRQSSWPRTNSGHTSSPPVCSAEHGNLPNNGSGLAILNSSQEISVEQSVSCFCAAGISGITFLV